MKLGGKSGDVGYRKSSYRGGNLLQTLYAYKEL